MDPSKEYDTDHTDDSYDMVNKSDQSSDESFKIVGSEESYDRTTDFEENENHRSEARPSGLGTNVLDEGYPNTDDSTSGNEDSDMEIEDTFGYPPEHSVQVYQSTDNPTSGNDDSDMENEDAFGYPPEHSVQDNTAHFYTPNYVRMLRFPKGIRRREDMRLRDVVEEHALRFLPAKSVCRFKAVSREWREHIARPIFPYEQSSSFRSTSGYFNKYFYSPQFLSLNRLAYGVPSPTLTFLPESVAIRSSCNGLLLCQSKDGKYYVCNPVTKEQDVLPQPKFYHGEVPRAVLTFDPERNFEASYQVICPFTEFGEPFMYFEIYSSVTRTWELVDVDCIRLSESEFKDSGFYANGVSYWETLDGVLLAFDMKDKFCLVQEIPKQRIQDCTMSFMEGEICYVSAYVETGNTCAIDIHAGFSMNLKRSFNVELPFVLRGAVRGRVQVLPCVNGDCLACVVGNGAFAFYPKDESVVVIREYGIDFGTEFVPYVNSLIPLLPFL